MARQPPQDWQRLESRSLAGAALATPADQRREPQGLAAMVSAAVRSCVVGLKPSDRAPRRRNTRPETLGADLVAHRVEVGNVEGLGTVDVHAKQTADPVDRPGRGHSQELPPTIGLGRRAGAASESLRSA